MDGKQGVLDSMKKDLFNNLFHGKRVFVTGDTGFKGSWLCVWLLSLGAHVTGMALPPRSKRDNFVRGGLARKIRHLEIDVRDYDAVHKAFLSCKPQIIFHLAAQPLVIESYKTPRETLETNVLGTLNVLEAARLTSSVKAIVNVTSDKCYDNKEWVHGYRETDPLGGRDPYSASKAASEIVSAAYRYSFFASGGSGPALATARAGNVIGGGDWAPYRIVPDCIRALLSSSTIEVRNPHATRPWQHVLEPLRGYLMLAHKLYAEGEQWSGPWNFGPLQSNSRPVQTLVEKVVSVWGSGTIKQAKQNKKPHEAGLLNLDISKAMTLLQWCPVLNFNDTVSSTIEDYRRMEQASRVFDVMTLEIQKYTDLVRDTPEHRKAE
jgi:CDP-glucose 4,6-dehydratase